MQQDYVPESFKKGKQFEEFVERNIFPIEHYELVTRTNSYEQNAERYAEDTLKPDFKFRCKVTGQEFWVEAKYRSDLYMDQIEALSYNQRDRFYVLEREEGLPVYVIIGYWGFPYRPKVLSLIPLKDYEYINIYRSFLKQYQIPNLPVTYERLGLQMQSNPSETTFNNEAVDHEETEQSGASDARKSFSNSWIAIAASALIIIFTIYSFAFSEDTSANNHEEQLRETVADYYETMNSNQIEKLPEYLSPKIDFWYKASDISHSEILKIARDRHGKYPYSATNIDWESFKVIPQSTGGYLVTYNMEYKFKKRINDKYQVYQLKMMTTWDEDFKLKSIKEIKI